MLSKVPSSLCSESSSESILLYFDSLLDFITGLDICYAAETVGAMVEIDIDYMWSLSTENDILVKSSAFFIAVFKWYVVNSKHKILMVEKKLDLYLQKEQTFSEYVVASYAL